jgi:hypothetical protein
VIDIHEHIRRASETPDNKSAADEAAEWLLVYLAEHGNRDEAAKIKSAARREHISDWALRRARERLKIRVDAVGFPAKFFWILSSTPDSLVDSQGDSQDRQDRQDKDSVVCIDCLAGAPENHQHSSNQSRPTCERCGRELLAPLSIERGLCETCSPSAGRTSEQARQLDQAINGKAKQCAAPCGEALGSLNITNGDLVHEDCRCMFGDCRAPLLDSESWQRKVCGDCMADPKKKTDKLKIRSLP